MKMTVSRMKDIIREEVGKIAEDEQFAKAGSGEARKAGYQAAKDVATGGITDQERGVIGKLQQQLVQAAKSGNIVQGNALKYAQLLSKELEKMSALAETEK
tara:strand:- start:145 stop:447 length:303 start_codon:yes stop_codon:yes gene_type:complete